MADVSALNIEIIEEPRCRVHRFRYVSDKRKPGPITGVNTTEGNKSYPKIRIAGLKTLAKIRVSCVTADAPYRVHPNELARPRDKSWSGIIEGLIVPPSEIYELNGVGVVSILKDHFAAAYDRRRELHVDPFNQGYDHIESDIDSKIIRLCFEADILDSSGSRCLRTLTPVVSGPIFHCKRTSRKYDIHKLEPETVSMTGGMKLKIFGTSNWPDDFKVRFQYMGSGGMWEEIVDPLPRQGGDPSVITVISPPYKEPNWKYTIQVAVQCVKPETDVVSYIKLLNFSPPEALENKSRELAELHTKLSALEFPKNQLHIPVRDETSVSVASAPDTPILLPWSQVWTPKKNTTSKSAPSSLGRTIHRRKGTPHKIIRLSVKKQIFYEIKESQEKPQPEQGNEPSNIRDYHPNLYPEHSTRWSFPPTFGMLSDLQPYTRLPSDWTVPHTVLSQPVLDEEPLPGPSGIKTNIATGPIYLTDDEDSED